MANGGEIYGSQIDQTKEEIEKNNQMRMFNDLVSKGIDRVEAYQFVYHVSSEEVKQYKMSCEEYINLRIQIFKISNPIIRYDKLKKLDEAYRKYGEPYDIFYRRQDNTFEKDAEIKVEKIPDIVDETKSEIDKIRAELDDIFEKRI